ncbi:hypothetical protein FRUB_04335 [Fimbriiglobus ruber]|uniref:Uncharacterized protein n=1 Tax=Fimbriiglobus ruber TaxID=1908690 RepID=A0A225E1K7_9BACT|nr:hypothetical protein FRUB_04335 [Fimbriiglobus ruber]
MARPPWFFAALGFGPHFDSGDLQPEVAGKKSVEFFVVERFDDSGE